MPRAANFKKAVDDRYRYDQSVWIRKAGTVTRATVGYGGIKLPGPAGYYYERQFTGSVNAAWFGVTSDNEDIGPSLQASIDASSDVFIPDGDYTQLTPVDVKSNLTIRANPGKAVINLTGSDYQSLKNAWDEDLIANLVIDGLSWVQASTTSTNGSYGPITLNGPNYSNITIRNCQSTHPSKKAYTNWCFIRIADGKYSNGITITNNSIKGARIGIEILDQHNPQPYTAKGIKVTNNRAEDCDFGISIAGTFNGVEASSNYLKNCQSYGIEFAGALHNSAMRYNKFEGSFSVLFVANYTASEGDGYIQGGYVMANNETVGTCSGKIELWGAGSVKFQYNKIAMTGPLEVYGYTNNGVFHGNNLTVTNTNYAIKFSGCKNNTLSGSTISNEPYGSNFATVFAADGASNINVTNNTIIKGSGGDWEGSFAGPDAMKFSNNRDKSGNDLTP